MDRIDGLNLVQRIVIVVALGVALSDLASYLINMVTYTGWTAYAPLTTGSSAPALRAWIRPVINLASVLVWVTASVPILRTPKDHTGQGHPPTP